MMRLKNSAILVTGGSLGIGKETARLLVDRGAGVAITGRDSSRLEEASRLTGAFPIKADVSDPVQIDHTYEVFMERFQRLDCLINNAGIGVSRTLEEVSHDDFQRVFSVNVFGAAMMASRAVPLFRNQKSGMIINVASTAALRGYPRGTVYAASKFALRGMTQCWQSELRKDNIRVCLINPSEVATAFGSDDREERTADPNRLTTREVAHAILSTLEMDDRGFIPELSIWATNPW